MSFASTPDTIPTDCVRGTTIRWAFSDADYPVADGWSKTVFLRGPSYASVTAATTSAGLYQFSLSATVSGNMRAGWYEWQEYTAKSNLRFLTSKGRVELLQDLQDTSTKGRETRTKARQMLTAVEEVLSSPAAIQRLDPVALDQLLKNWKQLKWEVNRELDAERRARGEFPSDKLYVRFK